MDSSPTASRALRLSKVRTSPYAVAVPSKRRLQIFALDPSMQGEVATAALNRTVVEVPWERHPDDPSVDGPAPGPRGEYVEVIDFDPATGTYYEPVDLNLPYLLAQDGLPPSEGNPQFHQQMVYAVVMRTIGHFESALGRRIFWAPHRSRDEAGQHLPPQFVRQLRVYPHALREANAYYSPSRKALLFGYFRATPANRRDHLPGGTVFTCLSHDIIAHETTHALLDGMHRRWTEPTNPDVLAFHEAFADVVAIFLHFQNEKLLQHEVARGRSDLRLAGLGELAKEMGRATGRAGALRNAIDSDPTPEDLDKEFEPHERGAILLAAIFDAFLTIYRTRSADLVRIATQGTGILPEGALHPDLVARLAQEASRAAAHVLKICIRALDYLPPIDITFGDYLRALITADLDLVPDDPLHYRAAFVEAFRRRGIYPDGIRSLSIESLRWDDAGMSSPEALDATISLGEDLSKQMRAWDICADRAATFAQLQAGQAVVHQIIEKSRAYKARLIRGVDLDRTFEVHAIRPVRRAGPDGQLLMDAVIELTQRRPGYLGDQDFGDVPRPGSSEAGDFWFRGGATLIVDLENQRLRYCIAKDIDDLERYQRTRTYLQRTSLGASLHATYFGSCGAMSGSEEEVFGFLHRLGPAGGEE